VLVLELNNIKSQIHTVFQESIITIHFRRTGNEQGIRPPLSQLLRVFQLKPKRRKLVVSKTRHLHINLMVNQCVIWRKSDYRVEIFSMIYVIDVNIVLRCKVSPHVR